MGVDPLTAGLIGGSSLISGILGKRGAKKGADARVAGIQEGVGEQRNQLAEILGLLAPGLNIGNQALNTFGSAFLPGFEGVAGLDPISGGDLSRQFEDLPGTQFALEQLEKQVGNSFASRGGAFGGNAMRELGDRTVNFASDRIFNNIRDLIGVGQGATGQAVGARRGTGANISNLLAGAGEARATGFEGAAGSLNQAAQGGLNNFLLTKLLKK